MAPQAAAADFDLPYLRGAVTTPDRMVVRNNGLRIDVITISDARGRALPYANGMDYDGTALRTRGGVFREGFWVTLEANRQKFRLHFTIDADRKVLRAGEVLPVTRHVTVHALPFAEVEIVELANAADVHRVYFPATRTCVSVGGDGTRNPGHTNEALNVTLADQGQCR